MNISKSEPPGTFFVFGALSAMFTVGLFVALGSPTMTQDILALHPAVTAVYEATGQWGLVAIPALLTLVLLAWGIYRLLDRWALLAAPPTASDEELAQALRAALIFTPEDLAENQNGRISPTQQQRLESMYRQGMAMTGCLTTVMLGICLFIAGFVWFGPTGISLRQMVATMPELRWVVGGVFALFLFMMINGTVQYILQTRQLPTQQVQAVEGRVRLSKTHTRYGTACAIRVGRKHFYATEQQTDGFWHGGHYRVYYLYYRPTAVLLSAEMLKS